MCKYSNNIIYRYNKITEKWWLCTCFGPSRILDYGLCGAAGAITSDYIYIFFGFESRRSDTNTAFRLDLTTSIWEDVVVKGPLPSARNKHGLVSYRCQDMYLLILYNLVVGYMQIK